MAARGLLRLERTSALVGLNVNLDEVRHAVFLDQGVRVVTSVETVIPAVVVGYPRSIRDSSVECPAVAADIQLSAAGRSANRTFWDARRRAANLTRVPRFELRPAR